MSRGHRGERGACALIGGIALVAMLALGAGTAWGLTTRTASTTVGPSPDASSTAAKCPRGKKVISGGFNNPGFADLTSGSPGLFAYASHKSRGRRWTVAAQNDNNGAGTEKAFVYCGNADSLSTRWVSATVPNMGTRHRTLTARCPRGSQAISGGFDNPGFTEDGGAGFFPFVSKQYRLRGWRVSVELFRPAPATLKVFAYCRASGGVQTRSASATVATTGSQTASATASCKPGERLISGGYSTTSEQFPGGSIGPDLWYYGSHKSGRRGWKVSAFHNGGAVEDGRFKALAYCEDT